MVQLCSDLSSKTSVYDVFSCMHADTLITGVQLCVLINASVALVHADPPNLGV